MRFPFGNPDSRLFPGTVMKIFGPMTLLTVMLLPLSAQAESRGTDAALGAVSGALVFGPVIGNSWGVNGKGRASYRGRTRPKEMQSRTAPDQAAPNGAAMDRSGQAG